MEIMKDEDLQVLTDAPKLMRLLEDIFTDEFMQKYTNFQNFRHFRYSSAVIADWNAENIIYSRNLLDHFVNESTRFSGWDALVRAAADARFHSEQQEADK